MTYGIAKQHPSWLKRTTKAKIFQQPKENGEIDREAPSASNAAPLDCPKEPPDILNFGGHRGLQKHAIENHYWEQLWQLNSRSGVTVNWIYCVSDNC